jgi:hypothetical protein
MASSVERVVRISGLARFLRRKPRSDWPIRLLGIFFGRFSVGPAFPTRRRSFGPLRLNLVSTTPPNLSNSGAWGAGIGRAIRLGRFLLRAEHADNTALAGFRHLAVRGSLLCSLTPLYNVLREENV